MRVTEDNGKHRKPLIDTRPITIIAVPDNGGGALHFERLLPCFEAHLDQFHFEAVTLPGFADAPPNPALRTLTDYAVYLLDVVGEQQRPVVLLGKGAGSAIVLEYAQHFPATVQGLILHTPIGAGLTHRRFHQLRAKGAVVAVERRLRTSPLLRPISARRLFENHRTIPRAYLRRFFECYQCSAAFAQMIGLIDEDWFATLRPRNVPTALIWDQKARPLNETALDNARLLLPNSTVRVMPEWGHYPMIERPDEYAGTIGKLAMDLILREIVPERL